MGPIAKLVRIIVLVAASLLCLATTQMPPANAPGGVVIISDSRSFGDGESLTWQLQPGLYKLELTATADGADAAWFGGACAGTGATRSFATTCELTQPGRLVVSNPTTFGLGASSIVTVKVVRLQ